MARAHCPPRTARRSPAAPRCSARTMGFRTPAAPARVGRRAPRARARPRRGRLEAHADAGPRTLLESPSGAMVNVFASASNRRDCPSCAAAAARGRASPDRRSAKVREPGLSAPREACEVLGKGASHVGSDISCACCPGRLVSYQCLRSDLCRQRAFVARLRTGSAPVRRRQTVSVGTSVMESPWCVAASRQAGINAA